jgi:hypothetical protein
MNQFPGHYTAKTPGKQMSGSSSMHTKKRGRPKVAQDISRPHRIVTFVTETEREQLARVVQNEERSMASVVHRIIKAYFE